MTAPPVPSATLVLLKDSNAGLQVLMTTRHAEAGVAAGALVFPGGKVDANDERIASRLAGNRAAESAVGARQVAAIRELHEECGILLGRRTGEAAVLSEAAVLGLRGTDAYASTFAGLVDSRAVQIASDLLVPFAHWITPRDRPRRFDTHFFVAAAPADQVARPDGREAVDAHWVLPGEVLAEADAGRVNLIYVTRMNLMKLCNWRSVAAALAAARASTIVTICPEVVRGPAGETFHIPAGAGYDFIEPRAGAAPTR